MSDNESKYSKEFIMDIMERTTAHKLVNTIKFNFDISELSIAVFADFGWDNNIYIKFGVRPNQKQFDNLYYRLSDIIKNNDNAADLLHESIQPENYTYKKLLGEGFEWVLTKYHLTHEPWIISSDHIIAAYN
jgi:hypothetical protein